MSQHPSHSTEHLAPPPEQAEEGLPVVKVMVVGALTLALFAGAAWWSYRIMDKRQRELQPMGPDPIPRQIGQAEIGIVDQVPFNVTRALQTYREEKGKRLGSWGWVDRKAGTVHMPIDVAMDELAAKSAKEQK